MTRSFQNSLFAATCAVFSLNIGAANAQDADHYFYVSYIGDRDYFDASGTRLNDACAIVQQERANYHQYAIKDDDDVSDPVFSNAEMRASIPDICVMTPEFAHQIVSGQARFIAVQLKRRANREIFEMRIGPPAQLYS